MSSYTGRRPLKPLGPLTDNPAAPPYPLPRPVIVRSSNVEMQQVPGRRRNLASSIVTRKATMEVMKSDHVRKIAKEKVDEFARIQAAMAPQRRPLPKLQKIRKYPIIMADARPIDPDTDEPVVLPDHGPPQGTYEHDEAIIRTANVGRMTEYRASFDRIARNMRLLGYSITECSEVFGITNQVFQLWRNNYPSFADAWFEGGDYADAKVARALYKRALGYEHEAVKIFNGKEGVVEVPYTERYPPDTAAGQFWLSNRQHARWRNRSSNELTGAGGTALNPPSVNVMIVPTPNGHVSRPPLFDMPPIEQAEPVVISEPS